MKSIGKVSSFEIALQCLAKIWEPGTEAFRMQQAMGVHSSEETIPAIERAGYEVCYVDLPEKVSGFAEIIAGKPHIILNRRKSPQDLKYTVPHELGHHILHLNPTAKPDPLGFQGSNDDELEANLFATIWLMFLRDDKQRNGGLPQNPQSSRALVIYLFLTITAVLSILIVHLFSRLAPETK